MTIKGLFQLQSQKVGGLPVVCSVQFIDFEELDAEQKKSFDQCLKNRKELHKLCTNSSVSKEKDYRQ